MPEDAMGEIPPCRTYYLPAPRHLKKKMPFSAAYVRPVLLLRHSTLPCGGGCQAASGRGHRAASRIRAGMVGSPALWCGRVRVQARDHAVPHCLVG